MTCFKLETVRWAENDLIFYWSGGLLCFSHNWHPASVINRDNYIESTYPLFIRDDVGSSAAAFSMREQKGLQSDEPHLAIIETNERTFGNQKWCTLLHFYSSTKSLIEFGFESSQEHQCSEKETHQNAVNVLAIQNCWSFLLVKFEALLKESQQCF